MFLTTLCSSSKLYRFFSEIDMHPVVELRL
jgi:hypothetical protein